MEISAKKSITSTLAVRLIINSVTLKKRTSSRILHKPTLSLCSLTLCTFSVCWHSVFQNPGENNFGQICLLWSFFLLFSLTQCSLSYSQKPDWDCFKSAGWTVKNSTDLYWEYHYSLDFLYTQSKNSSWNPQSFGSRKSIPKKHGFEKTIDFFILLNLESNCLA